ncbi:MAG: gliding motility-associated C-terminal domain-containing protein [Bacteroidia bacterium]|nr:gliding motility-associated C-terminal domain-containing protein [Bacteroidia bacterium]
MRNKRIIKGLLLFILFIPLVNFTFGQCTYSALVGKPNIVVNGDFSSGNTGFTCGYTYSTVNPLDESKYIVTTNASLVHFAFSGVDHTTGTGNFMVLNGSSVPTFVWNQTVTVLPNSNYNFSAWFKNIVTKPAYAGAPIATVELWINGVKISNNMALPDYPDVWKLLDTSWFSGSSTTANLSIKNIGTSLNGNDFAIDDISFKLCCDNPIKNTATICLGSGAQLSATGPGSINWSPTTGLSNPSVLNPIATPASTTQYLLTKTNGTCVVVDTFLVSVENCCFTCSTLPSGLGSGLVACYPFNGNANDESGNSNHGTVFGATLTNDRFSSPNKAYHFNGSSYIKANNSTSLSSATNALTISYWGKISGWVYQNGVDYASTISKSNSTADCSFRYSIRPDGASIINNGKIWTIVPGGLNNSMNVWDYYTITNNGNLIKIYKNGVLLGSQTSYSAFPFNNTNDLQIGRDFPGILDYFNGDLDDIRIYNRALSDLEVEQLYRFTSVTGLPTANAGTNLTACAQDSFQLNGTANGWYLWNPSTTISNPNVLNPKGKLGATNDYILTSTIGTCVARDTITVSITTVSANAGVDQYICKQDSFTLNGTANGVISWTPSAPLKNSNTANPKGKVTTSTNFILTNTLGSCIARDTVRINLDTIFATAGTDIQICNQDSFQLNGTGNGTITWSPSLPLTNSSILNPKGKVVGPTYFIINSTNGVCTSRDTVLVQTDSLYANAGADKNICKREVIQLNGAGNGTSFSWTPIKNIVNNLTATPSVNPDTTTTYFLKVTKGLCIALDTVVVNVNPIDAVILNKDTSFCIGDTISLIGLATGPNFIWTPTSEMINSNSLQPKIIPSGLTRVYFSVSDLVCTIVDSVLLSPVNITVDAGLDTAICEGDSVQLSVPFLPGILYSWTPNSSLLNANTSFPIAFPNTTTDYLVQAKKGNCRASDTIRVLVDTKPIVSAGEDKVHCFEDFVKLDGSISNATDFIWSPSFGLDDIKAITPIASVSNPTNYILTATNGKCVIRDTVLVRSMPKVIASFSADPKIGIAPVMVNFTDQSQNAKFYFWDFNDAGASSNNQNPSHEYISTGKYLVKLLVKDSLGCEDSTDLEIQVTDDPRLRVPNVFTPTGDFVNDSFGIVYNEAAFEFVRYRIYNRWGGFIYETSMPGGKWWDGTFNGQPCSIGVYFYILEAKALSGKSFNLSGTVTLLR